MQLTIDKQMFYVKNCRCLDSNRGPLEVTTLPTETQPLPGSANVTRSFTGSNILIKIALIWMSNTVFLQTNMFVVNLAISDLLM